MRKRIEYQHDEADRRIATTRSWSEGPKDDDDLEVKFNGSATTKTNHDERGNIIARIQPRGQITEIEWDRNHEQKGEYFW